MKFNRAILTIIFIVMTLLSFQMMGCGSSGGGTKETPPEVVIDTVAATSTNAYITADGETTTVITATVRYNDGEPVEDDITVAFTTTAGDIDDPNNILNGPQKSVSVDTAGGGGEATVQLRSNTILGTATVTATVEGISGGIDIDFVPGDPVRMVLTVTPNNLPADGTSTSTVNAAVFDAWGHPVDGWEVDFDIGSNGTLSADSATTVNGVASVTYIAGVTLGTDEIYASVDGVVVTGDFEVILVEPGANVGSVELSSLQTQILANGANWTTVTALVKDEVGSFVQDGILVTFTTTAGDIDDPNDIDPGPQQIVSVAIAGGQGEAKVRLTSSTIIETATVTATISGESGSMNIPFVEGDPNIMVLTATPNNLSADGTSTSTVSAAVYDALGHPVANGWVVNFQAAAAGGGAASGSIPNAASTVNGVASVSYIAGDDVDTDTVTATVNAIPAVTQNVDITLVDQTITVDDVNVASNKASLLANGADQATITVTVNPSGVAVDDNRRRYR